MIPLSKMASNVVHKLKNEPMPQLVFPAYSSIHEAAEIYYKEYLKLYTENRVLNYDLISTIEERNIMADKYNHIKVQYCLN